MVASARKSPKSKKPPISVRPPPPAVDDFVKRHDATTSPRYSANAPAAAATAAPRSTTRYTTKSGVELRRATLWIPAEAAEALGTFAARHQLRDSHIATIALCRLLGIEPPESLAHVGALFPR